MLFLLDTNIVLSLIRDPHGRIVQKIRAVGEINVCTSIIVAAELRFGAAKRNSPRLTEQVDAVLGVIETVPFESPADEFCASIRTQLEMAGTPIGGNDLIIAAQTLALDLTLITDNDQEFSRVNKLRVENWLRD